MSWLALDPGETTGWAIGHLDDTGKPTLDECGQFARPDLHDWLLTLPDSVSHAAIERFVPSGKPLTRAGQDVAIKVGAICEDRLSEAGVTVVWQSASDAKGVMTDARLKAMGLWVKGQPHARDAIRHLIIALRKSR